MTNGTAINNVVPVAVGRAKEIVPAEWIIKSTGDLIDRHVCMQEERAAYQRGLPGCHM